MCTERGISWKYLNENLFKCKAVQWGCRFPALQATDGIMATTNVIIVYTILHCSMLKNISSSACQQGTTALGDKIDVS